MKNILLVVDMQNGFVRRDCTLPLAEKIKTLLDLHLFDCVVATKFLNGTNSVYEKLFDWTKFKNEDETALVSGYEKYIDFSFDKYIYNCVNTSFIQKLCQLNDGEYPEKIFVIGVDTDCCVLATATSLFENNIRPVVLTSYCASNGGLDSHKAGILCMKRLIGEKQLISDEFDANTDITAI